MTQLHSDVQTLQTAALLTCYGFDLRGSTPVKIIEQWLEKYSAQWIRLAVVEALYQGRYKAISVEQLLKFWAKRGHPHFHFNHEFERLISHKLPKILLQPLPKRDATLPFAVPLSPPPLLAPILGKSRKSGFLPPPPLDFSPDMDEVDEVLPKLGTDTQLGESSEFSLSTIAVQTQGTFSQPSQNLFLAESPLLEREIHSFSPQQVSSQGLEKLRQILNRELTQVTV